MHVHTPLAAAAALAALALGLAGPLHAQTSQNHPKVRQALTLLTGWLDGQRAYEEIPGVSAAIVDDQTVLWAGGFGLADPGRDAPATAETVYSICSISKLFTSVAVMQLRDAGKTRLDDPIEKHLPWVTIEKTFAGAPPITVEGILTHSAGLPRESDYPYWSAPDFRFPTREQIQARIGEQQTLYRSAERFQYSNLGLTLAGELVAALSGESYDAYVRRSILQPLGLASTYPEMPRELIGSRLALGHSAVTREGVRKPVPFFETRGIAPAAGYASTVSDLARFAAWQFRILDTGESEVLPANTLREMHRVHWVDPDWETHWGLGFSVSRAKDRTFVGHGGSCPGFRSQLQLQTDQRIATVFMANASGVNTGRYTQGMYDIMAPAILAARKDTSAAKPHDPSLDRYAGTYSDFPWGGETLVVPWDDGLALLSLPSNDPMQALTRLKRVPGREHTFRRVRRDDSLAEEVRFEVGADGRAARFWHHSNPSPRVTR